MAEHIVKATIDVDPEAMMRVTALLKRKGYQMRRILLESDSSQEFASLEMVLWSEAHSIETTRNVLGRIYSVHNVEII